MALRRTSWMTALLAVSLLAGCADGVGGDAADGPVIPGLSARPIPPASPFGQYLVGRFAREAQDTAMAADAMLAAARTLPEQRAFQQEAFMAALLDGRPEALALAAQWPEGLAAQLVLFGADLSEGRWERAEGRVRDMLTPGPVQVLLPVLTAWTIAGSGRTDAALAHLRPFAEQGRLRALNALHAALIADASARPVEAVRFLRIALADQPDPTARFLLLAAGVLHRAGETAAAVGLLDGLNGSSDDFALAALGPARRTVLEQRAIREPADGVAEAYVALGSALTAHGLQEFSTMLTRLALRLRPGFTPALLLLAENLGEAGQAEAGLRLLDSVPTDDPLAGAVALRRAMLLDRDERVAEAAALLGDLAEALPGQPQPLLRLGDMQRRRGRFTEAVRAYDAAIARLPEPGPGAWMLFHARGLARQGTQDMAGAERDWLRALDLSPDQPEVLNELGFFWADRGERLGRAQEMLERAVGLRPDEPRFLDSLGWVLFQRGDLEGALLWLERAVELAPRDATINEHLGDVYWAAGRRDEARFQWQHALAMEPEPAKAARLARKLAEGLPPPALPRSARR